MWFLSAMDYKILQKHINKAMDANNPRWNVSFEMNGHFTRKLPPKHKATYFNVTKELDPGLYADCLTRQ
jgi:hypothetical protein